MKTVSVTFLTLVGLLLTLSFSLITFKDTEVKGQPNQKRSREFECSRDSTFSLSEPGILNLAIIQNGEVIDSERTEAAYGIISLSGVCGEIT